MDLVNFIDLHERLDRRVIYLDEVHTRGTNLKFPNGFRAAVTLGSSLTKDHFIQACMRMRKLGKGHSLTFWSSYEVHQQITTLKKDSFRNIHGNVNNNNDHITQSDILRWMYVNIQQATWDGLHHWATQSLSFQQKISAFQSIQCSNQQQSFTDMMMEELARKCLEPEVIELKRMYGASKLLQTIAKIYVERYQRLNFGSATKIHDAVLKWLRNYGGSKQRLAQSSDDEQQRELEQELEEERKYERPPRVCPCEPILHDEIKRLCDMHGDIMNLKQFPVVFQPLVRWK